MPAANSTQRFSSRVENYARYRPGYPPKVIDVLKEECGLTADSVIADIASGTGIFTRLLLENGNRVFGVEPNADMRKAGEKFLGQFPKFASIDGTAEATTLPDHSVDLVTAAQAAHWFEHDKARKEFVRILKAAGWLVLIWNERETGTTAFLRAYEKLLLTFGTDYKEVRHERTTAEIAQFFTPSPFRLHKLATEQAFDYSGVEGRLLSSSYTPSPEHPNYAPMLRELRSIFEQYASDGKVTLHYTTQVFYGRLG